MTATLNSALAAATRSEVEDLLYREAELLDEWDLDAWKSLYTDDARYVIPCTDDPAGDPARDLVLIDDDRLRMTARVERLNSRKAHREYPHSNVTHLITNVRLKGVTDGALRVLSSFTVWRFRASRETSYVGTYDHRLVLVDGELRIRSKRVMLANTTLRPASDVAIIL